MRPGDISLARFPFGGTAGHKIRPVLLLSGPLGTVPEVLTAYISSVLPANPLVSDIVADPAAREFAATGLKVRSVIRLHKLATLHRVDFIRRLGWLEPATRADVDAKLRQMLNL